MRTFSPRASSKAAKEEAETPFPRLEHTQQRFQIRACLGTIPREVFLQK